MPRALKLLAALALAAPVPLFLSPAIAHAECHIEIRTNSKGISRPVQVCSDDIPVVHPSQLSNLKSVCSPWQITPWLNPEVAPPPGATVNADYSITRVAPDGVAETMYFRSCADGIKHGWLRPFTPRDLANNALRDMKEGGFPEPTANGSRTS